MATKHLTPTVYIFRKQNWWLRVCVYSQRIYLSHINDKIFILSKQKMRNSSMYLQIVIITFLFSNRFIEVNFTIVCFGGLQQDMHGSSHFVHLHHFVWQEMVQTQWSIWRTVSGTTGTWVITYTCWLCNSFNPSRQYSHLSPFRSKPWFGNIL